MIDKLKYYLKQIVVFIITLTIMANIVSYYNSTNLNKTKLNIPNISLNDKPILVHFWATWCPTCKIESQNIQTLSKSYNVITVAVNSKDIDKYMKENNLTFKVIEDKDSILANQLNIAVYPTTLIYDKNKNLIFSDVGYTSTFGLYIRMWWAGL